jgi:hypothetical protein
MRTFVTLLLAAFAAMALAEDKPNRLERGAQKVERGVRKTAERTGNAIERGAKATERGVKRTVDRTEKKIKRILE